MTTYHPRRGGKNISGLRCLRGSFSLGLFISIPLLLSILFEECGSLPSALYDGSVKADFSDEWIDRDYLRILTVGVGSKEEIYDQSDDVRIRDRSKLKLAKLMKEKYLEYRTKLEESTRSEPAGAQNPILSREEPSTSFVFSPVSPLVVTSKVANSFDEMVKRLRSAEEAKTVIKSGDLRSEGRPVTPRSFLMSPVDTIIEVEAEEIQSDDNGRQLLEARLGPSAPPRFDPSIVVDFSPLIQIQNKRLTSIPKSSIQALRLTTPLANDRRPYPVLLNPSSINNSNETNHRRRNLFTGVKESELRDNSVHYNSFRIKESKHSFESDGKEVNKTIDRKSNLSSNFGAAATAFDVPNQTKNSMWIESDEEEMMKLNEKRAQLHELPTAMLTNGQVSVYVSSDAKHNMESAAANVRRTEPHQGEFGPFSDGNDRSAGIDPSEVSIPAELEISHLSLPAGVRDSLRRYLQPLLKSLKTLRKSVPGLPGLDYPILSVVPYTNFYCSNMPWPGFYADTEARCQLWHACDIDGRQSTFLCPNGTVFNQALMICDWWYNSDCITAPFLYSINERLFHGQQIEETQPYRRITPELLDTIFI